MITCGRCGKEFASWPLYLEAHPIDTSCEESAASIERARMLRQASQASHDQTHRLSAEDIAARLAAAEGFRMKGQEHLPRIVCTFTYAGKKFRLVEVATQVKASGSEFRNRIVVETASVRTDAMGILIWETAGSDGLLVEALAYSLADAIAAGRTMNDPYVSGDPFSTDEKEG